MELTKLFRVPTLLRRLGFSEVVSVTPWL